MKELLKKLDYFDERLFYLGRTLFLLDWDRAVNMPKKASFQRAKQNSILAEEYHKLFLNKELKSIVKKLKEKKHYDKLNFFYKRKVDVFFKEISKAEKLPLKFVKELSELESISQSKWEEAKEKSDFKIFQPYLEKLVEKYKEKAKLIDKNSHPYNVFLDDYEEGMDYKKIKKEFEVLKKGLIELLKKIKSSKKYKEQKKLKNKILKYKFDFGKQRELSFDISNKILDNKDRWILKESVHPFTTTISEDDVRITTAFKNHPMFSFTATVHESGHALFELQFDRKLKGILFDSPSLGLHESQSRFWENHVSLNKHFWDSYFKFFKKKFDFNFSKKEWYEFVNIVEPGFIRIEADEVTYPFHVIIRFELELELFEGKLKVKDLPKRWNEKYEEYLGVKVKKDSLGVLQDVHWSMGSFGYFPTYVIGTMYAATIYKYLQKKMNIDSEIKNLNFEKIRNWLKNNIHKYGRLYNAEEIIYKATKKKLNSEDLLSYLEEKYKKIYGFK